MPHASTRRTVDPVMLEARAAAFKARSIKAAAKSAGLKLALRMVDLTTLEGKDSPEKVRALCRKAACPGQDERGEPLPPVAAVCVYPALIEIARAALDDYGGESVNVAAVATGFPSGQFPLAIRISDTEAAVRAGADEIDMVINRGAFLAGRYAEVAREIREVKAVCDQASSPRGRVHLKVILETGELETYDNVRRASDVAIEAILADEPAADPMDSHSCPGFIKTSTGKVAPAATMPVTLCMLEAIRDAYFATGRTIGMKPAGGIRAAKDSLHYLVMVKETLGDTWLDPRLFRFGASALVNDILRQLGKQATGVYAARYDVTES